MTGSKPSSDLPHRIERTEPPLEENQKEQFVALWEGIFETSYHFLENTLIGAEAKFNSDLFYSISRDGETAATSHVTAARRDAKIGGLGEVATAPRHRRQGLAAAACERALQDFRGSGGEALFLGTGNPDAARVYHRLGWRKLCGSNAMVALSRSQSPEAYLVDYFRGGQPGEIRPASPEARVAMIPLIHTPHDWKILDANVPIHSNRYEVQSSVMGLYPKYESLLNAGGTWFELRCDRGRTAGLASARMAEGGVCRIDGFVHALYMEGWPQLIDTACRWGSEQGAEAIEAAVCIEDEEKREAFRQLGFGVDRRSGPDMTVCDRTIASQILRMKTETG